MDAADTLSNTTDTRAHSELRCDVFPSLPLNSEQGLMTILLCLLLLSSELQSTCSPGRGPPGPASHSPSLPQGIWEGFCPVCGGNSPCELDPIARLAGDSAPPAPTCPLHCSAPTPAGPARGARGPGPQPGTSALARHLQTWPSRPARVKTAHSPPPGLLKVPRWAETHTDTTQRLYDRKT